MRTLYVYVKGKSQKKGGNEIRLSHVLHQHRKKNKNEERRKEERKEVTKLLREGKKDLQKDDGEKRKWHDRMEGKIGKPRIIIWKENKKKDSEGGGGGKDGRKQGEIYPKKKTKRSPSPLSFLPALSPPLHSLL